MIKVLNALPMKTKYGNRLTVAQSVSRPRTARFTVKHGQSGHSTLASASRSKPTPNGMTEHPDKSLLRTINIQDIRPATLEVDGECDEDNNRYS